MQAQQSVNVQAPQPANVQTQPQNEVQADKKVAPVAKKVSEEDYRNMTSAQRADIKKETAKGEFFEGYEAFCRNNPGVEKKINSNKIADLTDLEREYGDTTPGLMDYLDHRKVSLVMIGSLKDKSKSELPQPDKYSKRVTRTGNVVDSVTLKGVNQPDLQRTQNGCWSVALSSIAGYNGVEIDQSTLRAYRPDANKERFDISNKDRAESIASYRDLISEIMPNVSLKSAVYDKTNRKDPFIPWSPAEKEGRRNEMMESMKKMLVQAIDKDSQPIAFVVGGHYRTIYGYTAATDGKTEKMMLKIHDPNDPSVSTISMGDLADLCYAENKNEFDKKKTASETYTFEAQWVKPLEFDKDGNIKEDNVSIRNMTIKTYNPDNWYVNNIKIEAESKKLRDEKIAAEESKQSAITRARVISEDDFTDIQKENQNTSPVLKGDKINKAQTSAKKSNADLKRSNTISGHPIKKKEEKVTEKEKGKGPAMGPK